MLSENAIKLLKEKNYFKSGESKWEDICSRVSTAIASAETEKDTMEKIKTEIYEAMTNLEFIFSTPCLINADINNPGQLSSCFIISMKDNIESITQCDAEYSKIFQKNGGAGASLSVLRPAKSVVETSNGYAFGVVGAMHKFDFTADLMTKFNLSRKGAIKKDIDDWHPDIYEFIHSKDDTSKLQRMNISIVLSEKFREAVKKNSNWDLKFPDYSSNKEIYDKEWDGDIQLWESKGYPIKIYRTVKARDLFNEMAEAAWKTGEPGFNFLGSMLECNKNKHICSKVASNPCFEFVNIPYSSCNLGSINLTKCIDNNNQFDFDKFKKIVRMAVRWLDNMITINKLPLEKIDNITKGIRAIGLGVMGWADLLFILSIKYNSKSALEFADDLFSIMYDTALETSKELAIEKGEYPLWQGSDWEKENIKVRNSNFISIAPTGTISFIADTTGGIEPLFALVYTRRTYDGTLYYCVNENFKNALEEYEIYSDELVGKIIENHGSCQGIKDIPKNIQEIFVTAHDIKPEDHINMLSTIQKHVDLSISKTINFNNSATKEDIKNIIMMAWENGCRGMTVYRDGSRENQTLSTHTNVITIDNKTQPIFDTIDPVDKDDLGETFGTSIKRKVACGSLHINVFRDSDGNLAEVFINTSRGGICQSNVNAISRLVSLLLRGGIKVDAISNQLKDIKCPACSILRKENKNIGISCADTIGRYLEEKYLQGTVTISEKKIKSKIQKQPKKEDKNKCPNCGEKLRMESGCCICTCGFSKCG